MNRVVLVENGSLRVLALPGTAGVFSFLKFDDSQRALDYLKRYQTDTRSMAHLRMLLAEDSVALNGHSDHEVLEAVAQRIAQKRYRVAEALQRPLPQIEAEAAAEAAPVETPRTERAKTWIEFDFVYPDNTPVPDVDYLLEDPEGMQEAGKTADDGKIRRDDISEGNYTAILRDVESVQWSTPRIKCDEQVTIKAKLAGYVYGTKAKINIYRELKESKADVVESLDARVENDAILVNWKYKYSATPKQKAESGVVRFIAEVEMEGGKHWGKTAAPLEVELKTIKRVEFASEKIDSGGSVDLIIETLGYASGTSATLELWAVDGFGQFKKSSDLAAVKLSGSKAQVRCVYGSGGGAISIKAEGEYFVVVKIDGRVARSQLLWCVDHDLAEATPSETAVA
jgi:hypothetical protein